MRKTDDFARTVPCDTHLRFASAYGSYRCNKDVDLRFRRVTDDKRDEVQIEIAVTDIYPKTSRTGHATVVLTAEQAEALAKTLLTPVRY